MLDSCTLALFFKDGLLAIGKRLAVLLDDVLQDVVTLLDLFKLG